MTPNPFLGVLLHAAGGFAAGSYKELLEVIEEMTTINVESLKGKTASEPPLRSAKAHSLFSV